MPELPEVETVRSGLERILVGRKFARVVQRRMDLRFPLPHQFAERLTGRRVDRLERRAVAFGAQELVLDTNASLAAAGGLYRSSGYVEIEPYNANPNATHWYGKRVG